MGRALTPHDVSRLRLARQFLGTRGPADAPGIVQALGAVQAQDYAGAKWALGLRSPPLTEAAVERSLNDGAILRTHLLRPTWHFVAAGDIRWMLALTGPQVQARMATYNRQLQLTPRLLRRSNDTIARALEGGRELTRNELRAALQRAGIEVAIGSVQRLAHVMMEAELTGVVCSGARRGKQHTYALLEERVPPAPAMDRDAALAELARRYFATRGPATAQDFSWWSGLRMADVKRAIAILDRELEAVEVDGARLWQRSGTRPAKPRVAAHLLPNYDELFIAYRDRSAIGQRLGTARVVTGGWALMSHIAIIDGQIVAGWKRVDQKGTTLLRLDVLTRLNLRERLLLTAGAKRLERFLGVPVRVEERRQARARRDPPPGSAKPR